MNLLRTIRAVLWSFAGIRKSSGQQEDFGKLNPFQVIAVAVAIVAMFVAGLITLVHWVAK